MWNPVPGVDNPAGVIPRGVTPLQLAESNFGNFGGETVSNSSAADATAVRNFYPVFVVDEIDTFKGVDTSLRPKFKNKQPSMQTNWSAQREGT